MSPTQDNFKTVLSISLLFAWEVIFTHFIVSHWISSSFKSLPIKGNMPQWKATDSQQHQHIFLVWTSKYSHCTRRICSCLNHSAHVKYLYQKLHQFRYTSDSPAVGANVHHRKALEWLEVTGQQQLPAVRLLFIFSYQSASLLHMSHNFLFLQTLTNDF